MGKFSEAVKLTLIHEGGYVNNKADRGAATNFGITQADLLGQDPKDLTIGQATTYYYEHFWKTGMSQIENQDVLNKIFDMGVLFGVGTAIRLAQSALAVLQTEVLDDSTIFALNEQGTAFLKPYKARLVMHVDWIVDVDKTQKVFLNGWINRINS